MTGTIQFNDGDLRYVGTAPFSMPDMTIQFVEFFLDLPPIGASDLSSGGIYRELTAGARADLVQLCGTNPRLFARFRRLLANFAVFAFPDTGRWPVPANEFVLEETIVDLQPIGSILCMIDGRRYLTHLSGDYSQLRTFDEFLADHGISVADYLDNVAVQHINRLSRVLQIVQMDAPAQPVAITFASTADDDMRVGDMNITPYLPDQIRAYADRRRFTITSASN